MSPAFWHSWRILVCQPGIKCRGADDAEAFGKVDVYKRQTYFKDFGPRIGFAYAPDSMKNTVIRGGYSIYYAPLTYSDFGDDLTTGFSVNPNFISPDNFTPESSFSAGFPPYAPPTQNPALETFTSSSPSYAAPSWGAPGMVQNWDLEVQHQIARDLIPVSYTHLDVYKRQSTRSAVARWW